MPENTDEEILRSSRIEEEEKEEESAVDAKRGSAVSPSLISFLSVFCFCFFFSFFFLLMFNVTLGRESEREEGGKR